MGNKYGGMTVNERLYESGLMKDFERAVLNKDLKTAIEILIEVELTNGNIDAILKAEGLERTKE